MITGDPAAATYTLKPSTPPLFQINNALVSRLPEISPIPRDRAAELMGKLPGFQEFSAASECLSTMATEGCFLSSASISYQHDRSRQPHCPGIENSLPYGGFQAPSFGAPVPDEYGAVGRGGLNEFPAFARPSSQQCANRMASTWPSSLASSSVYPTHHDLSLNPVPRNLSSLLPSDIPKPSDHGFPTTASAPYHFATMPQLLPPIYRPISTLWDSEDILGFPQYEEAGQNTTYFSDISTIPGPQTSFQSPTPQTPTYNPELLHENFEGLNLPRLYRSSHQTETQTQQSLSALLAQSHNPTPTQQLSHSQYPAPCTDNHSAIRFEIISQEPVPVPDEFYRQTRIPRYFWHMAALNRSTEDVAGYGQESFVKAWSKLEGLEVDQERVERELEEEER